MHLSFCLSVDMSAYIIYMYIVMEEKFFFPLALKEYITWRTSVTVSRKHVVFHYLV